MSNELKDIVNKIVEFRNDREWAKFHNPKDLAISLSIEAGELLECFQWKNNEEIEELLQSEKKIKIQEEIADVTMYLLLLCNEINIDLERAILDKLSKNIKKYPVDKCKGNSKKYTEL